jgi:hypothetical protein
VELPLRRRPLLRAAAICGGAYYAAHRRMQNAPGPGMAPSPGGSLRPRSDAAVGGVLVLAEDDDPVHDPDAEEEDSE